MVPCDQHATAAYIHAQETVKEGERLMNECMDALRNKEDCDKESLKKYVGQAKTMQKEVQKLCKKPRR